MITVVPPLSACLIITVSSFYKAVIALCSEMEMFLFTFDFSIGSRGIFAVLRTKLTKGFSRP